MRLCGKCTLPASKIDGKLMCDFCETFYHLSCLQIAATSFSSLKRIEGFLYVCPKCAPSRKSIVNIVKKLDSIEKILLEHTKMLQNHDTKLDEISSLKSMNLSSDTPYTPFESPAQTIQQSSRSKRTYAQIIDNNTPTTSYSKPQKTINKTPKNKVKEKKHNENIIFIKPKEKSDKSSEYARKKIKNLFDLKNDPISGLKTTGDGRIMVECKDNKSVEEIKAKISATLSEKFYISKNVKSFPKIMIAGVDKDDYSNDIAFLNDLRERNDKVISAVSTLKVIRKFSKESDRSVRVLIECDLQTYSDVMRQQQLYVGWSICNVYQYINVLRCYSCHEFGHHANECKNKKICSYCADTHMDDDDCQRNGDYKCINCIRFNKTAPENCKVDINHPVFSVKCPVLSNRINKKRNQTAFHE